MAPGSNPVSTHVVVSSAYERDSANAVSGEGLIINTTTTTTTKKIGYKEFLSATFFPNFIGRVRTMVW